MNDPQNDSVDDEGLGVAPPRRLEREHEAITTMTHDKDFKPMSKKSCAKVAKGQTKEKKR